MTKTPFRIRWAGDTTITVKAASTNTGNIRVSPEGPGESVDVRPGATKEIQVHAYAWYSFLSLNPDQNFMYIEGDPAEAPESFREGWDAL